MIEFNLFDFDSIRTIQFVNRYGFELSNFYFLPSAL